jgi:hypothetical protein
MAMRRKKFISKKVGTDDVVILEVNDTEFKCKSRIPGMILVDFISHMDEDDPKSMGDSLRGFFDNTIQEVDLERFNEYVRNPENDIDLEMLAEMAGWLAEQFSGEAPTGSSPASSDGLEQIGLGSLEPPLGEVPI